MNQHKANTSDRMLNCSTFTACNMYTPKPTTIASKLRNLHTWQMYNVK